MTTVPNGDQSAQLWIRMLDAIEAQAQANTQTVGKAVAALGVATERSAEGAQALSAATEQVCAHSGKLEDLVTVRLQLDRLMGEVKDLQDESKDAKVGKSDVLWKVLVGIFGAVSTALALGVLGLLMRGG